MKFGKELERLRKFGKVPWTTRLLDYYIARLERLVQKKLKIHPRHCGINGGVGEIEKSQKNAENKKNIGGSDEIVVSHAHISFMFNVH